jgi:hypothetical protein
MLQASGYQPHVYSCTTLAQLSSPLLAETDLVLMSLLTPLSAKGWVQFFVSDHQVLFISLGCGGETHLLL